jgi:hypothetical protein
VGNYKRLYGNFDFMNIGFKEILIGVVVVLFVVVNNLIRIDKLWAYIK